MKFKWLDPGLVLLFLGSFVVYANLHLAFIVMPLYVLEQGGNGWMAAWFNAVLAGAAVFTRFLVASWVDRYGRKLNLILSGVALVGAPLLILFTDSLAMLIPIRLIQGFGLALFPLAANTLVADLSPATRRGTALGLLRLVNIAALITGPPVAALVIERYGFQMLFTLLGLAGLAGMTPLLAIQEPMQVTDRIPVFSGFRAALQSRSLSLLFSSTTACGLAYGILITFLPLYAVQVGIENFGLFFTVFAFSGLPAGVLAGRLSDTLGRRAVLVPALVLFGLGVIYLSVLGNTVMFIGAVLAGIGYSASLTLLVTWVVDEAGRELRAASLGLFENGIDGGIMLGAFAFGSITALAGFGLAFSTTGLLLLLFAVIITAMGRGFIPEAPR